MPFYKYFVSDEQLEQVEEWKALADKYSLTLEELQELVYHVDKIKGLINK